MPIAGGTLPSCSMVYEREWDRLQIMMGPNMDRSVLEMDVSVICDLLLSGKKVNMATTAQRSVNVAAEMEKRVPGLTVWWR